MNALDLISKKRDGGRLSEAELSYLIKAYTARQIPGVQMSALLMVVFFRGMETEETLALTRAIVHSGEVLDLQ